MLNVILVGLILIGEFVAICSDDDTILCISVSYMIQKNVGCIGALLEDEIGPWYWLFPSWKKGKRINDNRF